VDNLITNILQSQMPPEEFWTHTLHQKLCSCKYEIFLKTL